MRISITSRFFNNSYSLLALSFSFVLCACGPDADGVRSCHDDYDCSGYANCILGECVPYDPKANTDQDGDGYKDTRSGGKDCNDNNPKINPGVTDYCGDGIDNNCDGKIDENCSNRILYVDSSQTDKNWGTYYNIHIMKNDGTQLHKLWEGHYPVQDLSCDPSGKGLAFIHVDLNPGSCPVKQIELISASTSDWPTSRKDPSCSQLKYKDSAYPNWSPTGEYLTFVLNNSDIVTLKFKTKITDGNIIKNLTNPNWGSANHTGHSPLWHPDGTKIVFLSNKSSSGSGLLHSYDIATSKVTLFSNISGIRTPDFCPDGSIVYSKAHGIYHFINSSEKQITNMGSRPKCAPDGKQIVFDHSGAIYTCSIDGQNLRKVTSDKIVGKYPEWCK